MENIHIIVTDTIEFLAYQVRQNPIRYSRYV